LIRILSDGYTSGTLKDPDTGELPTEVREDLRKVLEQVAPGLPEPLLALGAMGWIHLFGAVSFELFGQLNNVVDARSAYFDYQMRHIAALIGLRG
jgi:hypothetical protein